jgi:hypothetical protein
MAQTEQTEPTEPTEQTEQVEQAKQTEPTKQTEHGKIIKWAFISLRPGLSCDRMKVRPDGVKLNSAINPVFSAAFDVDWDGETMLRLEVTYKPFNFQTESYQLDKVHKPKALKGFSILPEFQFCHKWRWPSNCHIYGGAGFGGRLSHVERNEVEYQHKPPMGANIKTLRIDANGMVLSCVGGLIYKNRYELNFKFSNTQWGDNADNRISNSFVTMGFAYRL